MKRVTGLAAIALAAGIAGMFAAAPAQAYDDKGEDAKANNWVWNSNTNNSNAVSESNNTIDIDNKATAECDHDDKKCDKKHWNSPR
jgi:Spy/CpxP family protein refolding chaperone